MLESIIFDVGEEVGFDLEREHYLNHSEFEVTKVFNNSGHPIVYFFAESTHSKILISLIRE